MNRPMVAVLALSAMTASTLPVHADTQQSCAAVSEEQVAGLFERWNSSLATKDPAKVTENYASDAVILPTVSNKPRTTPSEIEDYFVEFLKKDPQGKIDTRTIRVGCNLATDVGTYTFDVKGADGKISKVPARYSFVYTYHGGEWKIAHHHSSAMPEKAQ